MGRPPDRTRDSSAHDMACLVARVAAQRDRDAFAILFDHYAPRLSAYLQRLGAEPALAEDVAQDALAALWRKAEQFDPEKSSVGTWLYRIARNRRIDLLRRPQGGEAPLGEVVEPVDERPRPDETLEARQHASLVRSALGALPAEQLSLVKLAFYEGRSHSEIATATGLPLGTVKSRIRLAFGRLRRRLEHDGLRDAT